MKSDLRVVAACLVTVICLVGVFILVDRRDSHVETVSPTNDSVVADRHEEKYYSDYKKSESRLVTFDPNTADSTVLLGLGLPSWTVRAIYKYRSKGGVFQSPEDLARFYGVTAGLYKELLPYIKISPDYLPASELVGPRTYKHTVERHDTVAYPDKMTISERISVNDADTNALKKVPGIGSYYAKKIVDLRERYGGFTDLSQLLSIKGLPEEALQYLSIPDGGVVKINVNKASFQQLAKHPYIGYQRARSITAYRKLKGKIKDMNQLKLIEGFSEEQVRQLEPYVDY